MTLGIDLSNGAVRAVTVNDDGVVASRFERESSRRGVEAVVRDARRSSKSKGEQPMGIGIATAFPGEPVPPDIATLFASAGEAPRTIGAGTAMALAEAWCGSAHGADDVVAFALGRHVTSGAIIGGRPLRGAHDAAGSVGWLAMNPVERDDYRKLGGLEAEVAAAGIVRRLIWRIKSGDHSSLQDKAGADWSRLTPDDVFAAARAGDGVSISVVRDTVKYVGMAVSNLAAILDPECVVLGGTLAVAGDLMLDGVRYECQRRMQPGHAERIRVVASTLGADAAAIGAARAAQFARR